MTVVESVLAGIERLIMPKLSAIEARLTVVENDIKNLREVMEVKFKAVDMRFDELDEKLAFDRRLSAIEERQQKEAQ